MLIREFLKMTQYNNFPMLVIKLSDSFPKTIFDFIPLGYFLWVKTIADNGVISGGPTATVVRLSVILMAWYSR